MQSSTKPVIIAGGGIGGLTMALTLHQLAIPCVVYESVTELKPLGVGINLQPNAVRELFALGISEAELDQIGIKTSEWALVGRNGKEIYSEPRGRDAGYQWPQYSVHRGRLQMLLYKTVCDRLGVDAVQCGQRVVEYTNHDTGVELLVEKRDGSVFTVEAAVLIGADGVHSKVRAHMHPQQPPIQWGGAIIYRGTSRAKPIRTDSSFIGLGSADQRMIIYPISACDENGEAELNWIAEITVDNSQGWQSNDWNRQVPLSEFAHLFDDWQYDNVDIPDLLKRAESVYEYPMVDRDPVDTWHDGNVILIGDAAHVMYPTGSNGASQAIVDTRWLGAEFVAHGVNQDALQQFDTKHCAKVSDLVLRNRGAGPFAILNLVDERCGGIFDDITEVMSKQEMQSFTEEYRRNAGFSVEQLNQAEPIIKAV